MYQCFTVIRVLFRCTSALQLLETTTTLFRCTSALQLLELYSDVPVLYSYLRDTVIFKIERIVLFFMGGCFLCFVDILDAKQPCSRGIRIKSQELLALDK